MSRSIKKHKIFGNTSTSDKKGKIKCNRKFRRLTRKFLKELNDVSLPNKPREVMNVWTFPKDGKHWWNDATKQDLFK